MQLYLPPHRHLTAEDLAVDEEAAFDVRSHAGLIRKTCGGFERLMRPKAVGVRAAGPG